jgi:MoxR-like ATPase
VNSVYVDDKIKEIIIRMVHATRPDSKYFNKKFDGLIAAGASPRASIWLYKIAKFKAFLDGKNYVSPEHLLEIAPQVLGHRVLISYEAMIDKVNTRKIVSQIASQVV